MMRKQCETAETIFDFDRLLFPACSGSHFYGVVVDLRASRVEGFDSLFCSVNSPTMTTMMSSAMHFVEAEHLHKLGTPLDKSLWARPQADRAIKQVLCNNCGICLILNLFQMGDRLDTTTAGGASVYTADDMRSARVWVGCCVLCNKLLH
jgi:hypothetical protein